MSSFNNAEQNKTVVNVSNDKSGTTSFVESARTHINFSLPATSSFSSFAFFGKMQIAIYTEARYGTPDNAYAEVTLNGSAVPFSGQFSPGAGESIFNIDLSNQKITGSATLRLSLFQPPEWSGGSHKNKQVRYFFDSTTASVEVITNKIKYNIIYDNGNGITKKYTVQEGKTHTVQDFGPNGCNFTASKVYLTCNKNDGSNETQTYSKTKTFLKWKSAQGESRPGEVLSNLTGDIKFIAVLNNPAFSLVEMDREKTFKQEITTTFLDGDKEIDVLKTNHYNTYKMAGWSHYAAGEAQYAPISSITIGTDTTLFAIWNVGIQKESLTVPDAPKKGAAYIFQNWINTVGNVVLIPQKKYTPDLSEGFHAVWTNRGAIRIDTKGQYVLAQPYIFSQGQWNLYLPYVRDNNNWKLGG